MIFNTKVNLQNEYQELRRQCQDFATALLDHTRTSNELEVMLNHDPTGPMYEHGERMHLNRLKLAIKLRQKKVCRHPCTQKKTITLLSHPHFVFPRSLLPIPMYNNYWPAFGMKGCQDLDEKIWPYKHWK